MENRFKDSIKRKEMTGEEFLYSLLDGRRKFDHLYLEPNFSIDEHPEKPELLKIIGNSNKNHLIENPYDISYSLFEGFQATGLQIPFLKAIGTIFYRCPIKDSVFVGGKFDNSKIIYSDLSDSNLVYSSFNRTNFEHSNLEELDLRHVDLRGVGGLLKTKGLFSCRYGMTRVDKETRKNLRKIFRMHGRKEFDGCFELDKNYGK